VQGRLGRGQLNRDSFFNLRETYASLLALVRIDLHLTVMLVRILLELKCLALKL
jgi:hypothetical protein